MIAFDPDLSRRIKDAISIYEVISSYIVLKKSGPGDYKGLCPFHSEKTPSFNVRTRVNAYKCFGCGKSGDVITFVRELENVSFTRAVQLLADRAGISIETPTRAAAQQVKASRQLLAAEMRESTEFWKQVARELWARYRAADLQWCRLEAWAQSSDYDPEIEIDAATYACYVVQRDSMEALELIWQSKPESLLAAYLKAPREVREGYHDRLAAKDKLLNSLVGVLKDAA